MTIAQIIGINIFAALLGFWLGNVLATRSLYRVNCSCHSPFRFALLKYAGISIVLTVMALGSGCAPRLYCRNQTPTGTPSEMGVIERCQSKAQCRDRGTGHFIMCPEDEDAAALLQMRETLHKVEKKAAKQRAGAP